MEINSEINKVFGKEMANLFASTISEEELKAHANKAWNTLNQTKNEYGFKQRSDIETYVRDAVLNRLYEKIEEVLKEPIAEETLEKKAREMVAEARKVAEETIIRDMAHNMANNVLSVYNYREEIVRQVLAELRVQPNGGIIHG